MADISPSVYDSAGADYPIDIRPKRTTLAALNRLCFDACLEPTVASRTLLQPVSSSQRVTGAWRDGRAFDKHCVHRTHRLLLALRRKRLVCTH